MILFSYAVIRYILIYKCVSAYMHHTSIIERCLAVFIDSMNMTQLQCLYIYTTHMCFFGLNVGRLYGAGLETVFVLGFA